MTVIRFLRDFHQALADGFDLALKHLAPSPKGVRVYEFWKQAQEEK